MAIKLEAIHKGIQQVKGELRILKSILEDSELTDEARQELEKAREEMAKGKFISPHISRNSQGFR